MRTKFSCAASILLMAAVVVSGQSTAPLTAKEEAISALRDAHVIVLRHVRVIDGTGAPAKEDQSLAIEGAKITALGRDGAIDVPQGARSIDLGGDTVLPGLVMLHEHLFFVDNDGDVNLSHPQHFSYPRLYLAYGVTTIRTAGTDFPYMDANLKRRIDGGAMPGPEIHLTSPYFSGEGDRAIGAMILHDVDSTRRAVRYWAAEGFTSFKAYRWIPKDVLSALIDEAHRLKLTVTAHLDPGACEQAAEMGIDNIEHGFAQCLRRAGGGVDLEDRRAEALTRLLLEKHVTLTETSVLTSEAAVDTTRELVDASFRGRYAKSLIAPPAAPAAPLPGGEPRPYGRLLLSFMKAGGRVVLGSDAGFSIRVAGLADHQAIERLVIMGIPPLEAIRIATLDGATFLRIRERTGSIQVGKEADLLIVRGNPAEHIQDIENVHMVFNNGVAYDPKTLLDEVRGQVGWK